MYQRPRQSVVPAQHIVTDTPADAYRQPDKGAVAASPSGDPALFIEVGRTLAQKHCIYRGTLLLLILSRHSLKQ